MTIDDAFFFAVYLSQVLLLSFYFPSRVLRRARALIEAYPPSDYPKLYPAILTNMVAIGEKTGNLSQTLTYLGEMYEGEVDDLTKGLSSSIEPVLMVVMGLLVGIIAVSVITPIYEITQHLSPK